MSYPIIQSENSLNISYVTAYDGPDIPDSDNAELTEKIVTNYNVFKTQSSGEFDTYGVADVVTGWKYDASDQIYPSHQYRYATKSVQKSKVTKRFNLADMDKDGNYQSLINKDLAKDISIPSSVIRRMELLCVWASN